ncbi:hypothetical protein TWF730_007097 [Orbilia blumenaviensis]|uniref:Uncharacterized protein n=1 Tax=Orbilia blumenaviensis TaxID=1796055 RepID=A0AAV9VJL9_9PEZI
MGVLNQQEQQRIDIPEEIPASDNDVTRQIPPAHPTIIIGKTGGILLRPNDGLISQSMRPANSPNSPFLVLTIAIGALLVTLVSTRVYQHYFHNYNSSNYKDTEKDPTMFSRINKFKDQVHHLANEVHQKLHARDSYDGPGSSQQNPLPQPPPIPPKPVYIPPETYATLRRRWMNIVVGDFNHIDREEKTVRDHIARMSWGMGKLLETYNPGEKKVFDNCGEFDAKTVWFKNTCGRLLALAISWSTPGTRQYQDEDVLQKLLHGIDVVYENFFLKMADDIKQCIQTRANWWNIQIGAPQNLADIGVILYEHLGDARRQRLGAKILELVGNPFTPSLKGGNRSWVSRIIVITGIFTDNADTIRLGIRCMSADGGSANVRKNTLFGYIQPGDGEGLYEDGSLISHDVYPYAGGYGLIMLGSVARLFNLLNSPESPEEFRVRDPNIDIIYDCVERNFMPVVWQGIVFEHVRGRGIARKEGPGWDNGHVLIHATALLTLGSPASLTPRLSSYIRLWQSSNPGDIFAKAEIPQISTLKTILSDPNLPLAPIPRGCFATPMQEHFAYHSPEGMGNWCFTLSMCSTRIGRAEALNNENVKSWYQGDGMTYLYTSSHKTHFSDDYWPTMDPLHCPGTTNHQTRPPENMVYKCMGFRSWSGGVCWAGGGGGNGVAYRSNGVGARFAVVSMDHLSVDKLSAARKSWFFTEEGIVALGAGCKTTINPPAELHTTIESRNLDVPGKMLVINGEEYTDAPGWTKRSSRVHWAWLEGTAGYIFLDAKPGAPADTEKLFSRTQKCGAWRDINGDGRPDEICREYVNIVLNHGVNPTNSRYAYAILPLATREQTEEKQRDPKWRVLKNEVGIQAIEYAFGGAGEGDGVITMVTFWDAGEINGIRVDKGCQVIWGRWKGEWCLSVSDPSHKNGDFVVNVEIEDVRLKELVANGEARDEGVWVEGCRVTIAGLKDGAAKSVFFKERGHDEL